MEDLVLDGQQLRLREIEEVAISGRRVAIAPPALDRMIASRACIDRILAAGEVVYGVNTGFGRLSDVHVEPGTFMH